MLLLPGGDRDHWLFSHFSGLRQPSTGRIVVWGNNFEMIACIFGSLPLFLVLYWGSGSNPVPFPLPLPEACVGFSLWDSLPSPQTSTETTVGGCNRREALRQEFPHDGLAGPFPMLPSWFLLYFPSCKAGTRLKVPLPLLSTIPTLTEVFLSIVLCRNLWEKLTAACSH